MICRRLPRARAFRCKSRWYEITYKRPGSTFTAGRMSFLRLTWLYNDGTYADPHRCFGLDVVARTNKPAIQLGNQLNKDCLNPALQEWREPLERGCSLQRLSPPPCKSFYLDRHDPGLPLTVQSFQNCLLSSKMGSSLSFVINFSCCSGISFTRSGAM